MALATVLFGVALWKLLPGQWPLMPFPQPAPVEIAGLLGVGFGFVTRRMWAMALPLTALVALNPSDAGFAGAIVATLVIWPFAAGGGALGALTARFLQRRALRHTIRGARRPPRVRPPEPAEALLAAARGDQSQAASATN